MLDVGFGFYMVKFDLPQDTKKVVSGGPQMVFDHYPTVRPWIHDFSVLEVKIERTLVWIRFPLLGMEYYDESLFLALASVVWRTHERKRNSWALKKD